MTPETKQLYNSLAETLKALAEEDKLDTVEKLIAQLVYAEDHKRHILWNRKEQKFIRTRCGRKNCKEQGQK